MAEIKIRDQTIEIDIESELHEFEWENYRWTDDKLLAASPFRDDRRPSFFVNLDTGGWADSGAHDEYASGNIVKLLAYMRDEPYESTEDYLIDKYGERDGEQTLRLRPPRLRLRRIHQPLPQDTIIQAPSRYLSSRGISVEVQAKVGTGRGKHVGFTAIPWKRANGDIMNVMYRATKGKTFFYEGGGQPIGQLIFGINIIHAEQAKEIVVCEAPIDAMSWMTAGVIAVAVGGVNLSDAQADILHRAPIDTIILGGDNDKAGEQLNAEVERKMGGMYRYRTVDFGRHKDANDVLNVEGVSGLGRTICENFKDSLLNRFYTVK